MDGSSNGNGSSGDHGHGREGGRHFKYERSLEVNSLDASWINWNQVWLKTIALAWSEPGFAAALMKDPMRVLANRPDLNYRMPQGVDLRVEVNGSWSAARHAWNLPATKVIMRLPPRPERDEVMALAAYSQMIEFFLVVPIEKTMGPVGGERNDTTSGEVNDGYAVSKP